MKNGICLLFGILIAGSGMIEVQRNNVWLPIAPGAQINDGERVRTGVGSTATLDLGSGTIISLSQASEIQVQQTKDPNFRTYIANAIPPFICVNSDNPLNPLNPWLIQPIIPHIPQRD